MTTGTMHPKTVDLLAKLAGMISSSHDGEALNAARMLDRKTRENGTSLDQIVRLVCGGQTSSEEYHGRTDQNVSRRGGSGPPLHRRDALWALRDLGLLSDKETVFLRTIASQARPITPKQQDWLDRIVDRLRREARA